MLLLDVLISTLVNLVVLAAVPFGVYFFWHRWRHRRPADQILERAGLQIGDRRLLAISTVLALVTVAGVALFPPSLEAMTREGSAHAKFAGPGLSGVSMLAVLLYGVVQTGFSEELLFRGLVAGSLGRRLGEVWGNVVQALVFLAPHLLLLAVMPEMWPILILVLMGALVTGWIRIRSGSILGPWMIHAAANVATSLSVVLRSV